MQASTIFRLSSLTVVLAILTMSLGSYVSKIGAGMACPDWPLCPLESDPFILLEFSHRIIAFTTFLAGLTTFIAAFKTSSFSGRPLAYSAFVSLTIQVFLVGAVVIYTEVAPLIVAAHQGVAATVVALYSFTAASAYYSLKKKVAESITDKYK